MLTTTAKKAGNSIVLSILKQFEVKTGTTYVIYKVANGNLTLTPKISNPFTSEVPYAEENDPFWQENAVGKMEAGV